MTQITNLETYTKEMVKAMEDKVSFLQDYLTDIDHLVDFGCADGTFLSFIDKSNPALDKIGVDINYDMIKAARNKIPTATFLLGTSPCISTSFDYSRSALNLSSVLHEIYSYSSVDEIEDFWNNAVNSGFKYIFIRDMISNVSNNEIADASNVKKVYDNHKHVDKILDFESTWGSVKKQKNLVHFLLKYRYDINWSREVKENYLPLSGQDIVDKLQYNYEILYREEFVLPFIKEQVKQDFDIDLRNATHIKIVARKKMGV